MATPIYINNGDTYGTSVNATSPRVGIGTDNPGARCEIVGGAATSGTESIALKVTDGSVTMFEIVDSEDSNNKDVTIFRSLNGQICVVPKAATAAGIQEAIDYLETLNDATSGDDRGGTTSRRKVYNRSNDYNWKWKGFC